MPADTLVDLKTAWATAFSKRAHGGWWALSGFSLQTMAALARMLKSELIDKKPRGEVDIESVSDAILNEDKISLVQIKRTLTKSTLEAAFAEAYDIASLCSTALQDQLQFQVVTMKRETGTTLDIALARHALRERTAINEALLQRTLAMFDRKAPIRITADPAQALRLVLWNAGVENPGATMDAMLGGIFAAFNGGNRAGVQIALIQALDRAKNDVRTTRPHGGHLFVPGDLAKAAGPASGTILVDASPRMLDLKLGRFLERTGLLDEVFTTALDWDAGLEAQVAAHLQKIPVFCIRGRSGDGKSVLLLQLVAALLERRAVAAVTGLASFSDLQAWLQSRPKIQPGEPIHGVELAYIDDLPRRVDADLFGRLIEECYAFASRPAALLTCGISESLPKTSNIQFDFFPMPPPTANDQKLFSHWVGSSDAPPFEPRQSLATMLVDLRRTGTGEAPLADQFQQKLRSDGLWPLARHVIAANLFGIPGAVSTDQAVDLETFTFEGAGVTLRADRRDGGIELGHAEYLEPLYLRWVGGSDFPQIWGRDIGAIISVALQNGDGRLARTLLGQVIDMRALRKRLKRLGYGGSHTAPDLLNAAFSVVSAENDDPAMAPLMRLWLAAQRAANGAFMHNLEARAVSLLKGDVVASIYKAQIALQLASGPPEREADTGTREVARAYLAGVVDEPAVVEYYKKLAGRGNSEDLVLVRNWLRRHQRSLRIAPVLASAIRTGGPDAAEYRSMAARLAGAHPRDSGLGDLVRTLALQPIEGNEIGLIDRWLGQDHPPRALHSVYAQLLKVQGARRYLDRALAWMEQNIELADSHDLLARLIEMQPDYDLGPLVQAWFDSHPYDPGRYSVIGALLTHPRFEIAALRSAIELLAGSRSHHTGYLFAMAIPVVKALTVHELHALAKTLPPRLQRPLKSLRAARQGPRTQMQIHR
ncbi:hypothetical protein LPN01_18335 [Sphingomonas sp. A2-49]|uniref:hypothetical protein n=1 Tax=Sphingomonas sp. A2-49 TaxID=1391375 RepID=UPI0021D23852|nr:hypothetical protein [Sphingomonas sp. A2-49]MCU6456040.1 hypothetical protein [Sphingomonas sp. A2-49]